ncbi:MAG TPA: hypothetical protein VML55_11780, partial [Planctomycetaceae bacterium]|nr:hypothetical protein [Planctomycetaceae bacterium]
DEQRAAREQAEKRYAAVFARYRQLARQIMEERDTSRDSVDTKQHERELAELTSELRTAHRALSRYPRIRSESRGWVWVFLRSERTDMSAVRVP